MPTGIFVNCAAVAAGALLGTALRRALPGSLKEGLPLLFGLCAMGIGVTSIIKVQNMSAVVLTLLLGYTIGHLLQLERRALSCVGWAVDKVHLGWDSGDSKLFITVIALFCCSGLGWYGALVEGLSGDPSLLLSKSILDFFTALVFATTLGLFLCSIPVLQLLVYLVVFFCGRAASAYLTPAMFADLSACGGLLALAAGLRVARIKELPVIDMMPALVLILPISALWTRLLG